MVGQNDRPPPGHRRPANADWPPGIQARTIPYAPERIDVTAHIVWEDGTEQWFPAWALRWRGRRVHVHFHDFSRGVGVHTWLDAADVERRVSE